MSLILTILSFNMWNNPYYKMERCKWFCKNILKDTPDIILLQEVNNGIVLKLTKALQRLNYEYRVSNVGRGSYEMICSRWPIIDWKFSKFSTSPTGRGIMWADLRINERIVTVSSAQLEQDPDATVKRIGQLDCICKFLANKNHINILGCDTGLRKDEKYDLSKSNWKDSWVAAGRNKLAQYTVDFNRNSNVTEQLQYRPDRIYYQGDFDEPVYSLTATEKIKDEYNASQHFVIKLILRFG